MTTIVLILICILMAMFAVGAIIENIKTKRELKQQNKKEKQNAKIDKETDNKIESVIDGAINNDVHTGSNILHQLAQERK